MKLRLTKALLVAILASPSVLYGEMFNGAAAEGGITLPNSFCDYSGSSYIWSASGAVDFTDCDGFTVANNTTDSGIRADGGLSVTEVGKVLIHNNDTANGGRGGLLEGGSVSITGNTDVTFSNNDRDTIYYQGSIGSLIHSGGAVALTGNGAVSFTDNINSSTGGLLKGAAMDLSGNASVTFLRNAATTLLEASGLTLSNNAGGVLLEENSGKIQLSGGGTATHKISGNGEVVFRNNTMSMKNDDYMEISGNAGVRLEGNVLTSAGDSLLSAYRGLSMSNNGAISITGNSGGSVTSPQLVYSGVGSISISENAGIKVSDNSNYTSVLYAGGSLSIADSGTVLFDNNDTADGNRSGLLKGASVSITGNTDVTFSNNDRDTIYYRGSIGSLIHSDGAVSLTGNGAVSFTDNINSSTGGLLKGSTLSLSENNSVTFQGNAAAALMEFDGYEIHHNGSVLISGNTNRNGNGAIHNVGANSISIVGNGSVVFENNSAEISSAYLLRGIYNGSSSSTLVLSAKNGGDISFYDSVYNAGGAVLNGEYTDAEGVSRKAGGSIVFSGAKTEAHLRVLKGEAATEAELANSRTSTIAGAASLMGGTLRVEDKAVLKINGGLTVAENGAATVQVADATLDVGSRNLHITAGNTLEMNRGAVLNAATITITKNAVLSVRGDGVASMLDCTLGNIEGFGSAPVLNTVVGATVSGNLVMEGGAVYEALEGTHTALDGGELLFSVDESNRIELVLDTAQAALSQLVLFSDVSSVNFTSGDRADAYFRGDWITELTTIHYDDEQGVVYLQSGEVVPEPATATLSLLALAALAVRRRR